jgi:exosome complex component RRP40
MTDVATVLTVVLPGDDVTQKIQELQQHSKKAPKLGIGLRTVHTHNSESNDSQTPPKVLATCAGRLVQKRSNNTFYIQQNIQRYRPALEDRVIGIVEDRVGSDGTGGDVYRINIGASHPALLSSLAFEGATKRNRPHLSPGMLLYCRIADTPPSMDCALSCQLGPHDAGVPRKDWMTNEGTYGVLQGGTCKKIPLGLARELLYPNNLVLTELAARQIAYEVCVGVNGFVWIHSARPEYTIMIQNAILNSQILTESQVLGMVKSLVETVKKQIQENDD